ncbi:MAG: type II toxin-antitoxin system RelE/ParE family toxin [Myxococcaceae bacterium]
MIRSFQCKDTEKLFNDLSVKMWRVIERPARRKLAVLNAVTRLEDLKVPPGNRLEKLSGDRKGAWSIRINDQWRICFRWAGTDVFDVEIVDYH